MQLQPDTLLQGRYRVHALLAQGGMGAVYKAVDERLGNTVALKQTLMADPALRAAFEREARLLAGLQHPALPVVSDHFSEGGGQFLVMQFIPGDDLAALLRKRGGPFPIEEVLGWADRLLDALDYLHGRAPPVIHRDIKPQNLKLTPRGEVVLLDFGLAKGQGAGVTAANPSLFGYTPQYAPMEQIQGSGTDARSDLYAVGATLAMRVALRGSITASEAPGAQIPYSSAGSPTVNIAAPTLRPAPAHQAAPATAVAASASRPQDRASRVLIGLAAVLIGLLAMGAVAFFLSLPRNEPVATGTVQGQTSGGQITGSVEATGVSRAVPLPVGAVVTIEGWEVEVLEQVRGEQAYEMLRKANGNNGPPAEGAEYLLLHVRATSTAPGEQWPLSRGDLLVIGERDRAYTGFAGVPPDPAFQHTGQVASGAVIEGWSAYEVGTDEEDLVLAAGSLITGDARYLALSEGAAFEPDLSLLEVRPNEAGVDWREPAALGETVITDDWEITVTEVLRGDEAWQRIEEGNSFNDPPAEGMEYLLAYVMVRRIADEDDPDLISASYFTGTVGDEEAEQLSVVVPEPELDGQLFPGGTAEGWVVVMVPADDLDARLAFQNSSVFFEPDNFNTRYFVIE